MSKLCRVAWLALFLAAQFVLVRAQNADLTKQFSQAQNLKSATDYPNLKKQAELITQAFLKEDFDTFVSLTYPKLVQLAGGRNAMIAFLKQGMKENEAQNIKILSQDIGEPHDLIKAEKQLFAIVPTVLKMKIPQGTLVAEGFLIGISEDAGENWTFVDGTSINKEKMKELIPAAAESLKLPQVKRPVLQKDPSQFVR